MAHDQAGLKPLVPGTEPLQAHVQFFQTAQNETHAAILPWQWIEDGRVEHEHTPDLSGLLQCVIKRSMVIAAQISAEPDESRVDLISHVRLKLGLCPKAKKTPSI